ncbi:MAG TPA: DUF3943 domain-containing protein [Gemmatimonadaceae bacterium]
MRIRATKVVVAMLISACPAYAQTVPRDSSKSYLIPAIEIVGFDALLNVFDRLVLGDEYNTSLGSIRRNLRKRWVTENDPFQINQFGHPYQGAMYHGFARASGLGYWTSAIYTFAGSAMWEIAGETTTPSWNDQIASGIAGSFLGEALYRIGNLVLETGPTPTRPGRRLVTTATSVPLSVNRRIFGRRFDELYPSRDAAYYRRVQFGATGTTLTQGGADINLRPTEGVLDLSMEYGLPGANGYVYTRPFDYFSMQVTASTGTGLESILLRGLLVGTGYGIGSVTNGTWGLYGSYDYISPQLFRISSTALSLGTTAEWRPSPVVTLQGTALAGAGFAAIGTLATSDTSDYHYGIAPHALAATRIIFGDRAALDLSARDYYVSRVAGTAGHDNIARLEAAFSLRFHHQQALAVRYLLSRRDAFFPETGSRRQARGTLGLFYSLLGHDRFGAVRRD